MEGRGWGESGRTPWVPEDIASMSIGQFVVQVTPIQIARAYAAICLLYTSDAADE